MGEIRQGAVEAMTWELGDVGRASGLKAVEVGMVVVPDDQDCLADDAGALDGPPVAAVAGVCAVVAQDVELAGRDAVGMLAACDRRAERVVGRQVRLGQQVPVDVDGVARGVDRLAWQRNDALDEVPGWWLTRLCAATVT